MKVTTFFLLNLTILTIFSCGKGNKVDGAIIYKSTEQQDNIENSNSELVNEEDDESREISEDIENQRSNTIDDRPLAPRLNFKVSNMEAGYGPLSLTQDIKNINNIKKDVFEKNDLNIDLINIISSGISFNHDHNTELFSIFNSLESKSLNFSIKINNNDTNMVIRNILVNIVSIKDSQITILGDFTVNNLKETNITHRLNKETVTQVYQNKARIGFQIISYDAYINNELMTTKDFKPLNHIYIVDQKVKKISSSANTTEEVFNDNDISYNLEGDVIYMLDNLPNSTTVVSYNINSDDPVTYSSGKWFQKDNVFAYVRNINLREESDYFYELSTHTTYHTTVDKFITRTLTYLEREDLNINLPAPFALINIPIQEDNHETYLGHRCSPASIQGVRLCHQGNQAYTLVKKKRSCTFKQATVKTVPHHNLKKNIIKVKNSNFKSTIYKNNFYIKTKTPLKLATREGKETKALKQGFTQNNCNYKLCHSGEANCYLESGYVSEKVSKIDITKITVNEKN